MRILIRPTESPSAEKGAVAIVVAFFVIIFTVLAAFAVDIGNAYANKRQLSVAADASALAAAKAVGEAVPLGLSCQAALDAIDEQQIAVAAADELNAKNNQSNPIGGSEPVDSVQVECIDSDNGGAKNAVAVTVNNSRRIDTFFAGVIGIDALQPDSSATAVFAKVPAPGGLRPWAVCDGTALAAKAAWDADPDPNDSPTFYTGLSNKIGICSDGPQSGNWGAMDLDENLGGNSNAAGILAAWTLNGYFGPQLEIPGPIGADPGQNQNSALASAFQAITGEIVQFPAVSNCTDDCNGNTGQFITEGVITAKVCGVLYGNINTSGDCWKDPASFLDETTVRPGREADDGATLKNDRDLTATLDFTSDDEGRSIVVEGAGKQGADLETTVESVTTGNSAVLASQAKTAVTGANVELLPVPAAPAIPTLPNGDFVNHIQFQARDYTESYLSGSEYTPCEFDSRLCAGAVLLWR